MVNEVEHERLPSAGLNAMLNKIHGGSYVAALGEPFRTFLPADEAGFASWVEVRFWGHTMNRNRERDRPLGRIPPLSDERHPSHPSYRSILHFKNSHVGSSCSQTSRRAPSASGWPASAFPAPARPFRRILR